MEPTGYAITSLDDVDWTAGESGSQHAALTVRLGCSDTAVDAYRTRADGSVSLPPGHEQLCVPVDGPGALTAGRTRSVGQSSVALVPAGTVATIGSEDEGRWIVVSAEVEPSPESDPVVVDLGDLEFAVPTTSEVRTARLTDRLGCRGTKVNARRLAPGQAVPYHTEGTQEELFVPLDGDGTVRVDGESYPVPRWSVMRVAPAVPRSAVNRGESATSWLMVGAPPTGAADEWDPGAETREWPGPN